MVRDKLPSFPSLSLPGTTHSMSRGQVSSAAGIPPGFQALFPISPLGSTKSSGPVLVLLLNSH